MHTTHPVQAYTISYVVCHQSCAQADPRASVTVQHAAAFR